MPDPSAAAVTPLSILYTAELTDAFSNGATYGSSGNLVEISAFIITGAPSSIIVGNLIIDIAYELHLSQDIYGIVRPTMIPPSVKMTEALASLSWLKDQINVRS